MAGSPEFLVAQFSVHIQLALPSPSSNKLSTLPSFTSCDLSPMISTVRELQRWENVFVSACRRIYCAVHIVSGFFWTLWRSGEAQRQLKSSNGKKWCFTELPLLEDLSQFKPGKRWQRPDLGRSDTHTNIKSRSRKGREWYKSYSRGKEVLVLIGCYLVRSESKHYASQCMWNSTTPDR